MGVGFVISKKLCDSEALLQAVRFLCKDSRIQKWQMFLESDRTGVYPWVLLFGDILVEIK